MIFEDRADAGRQLAKALGKFANREDVIVLGIPRGGVVVAFEIASALKVSLDTFLSRKLGVPGHEELAFGAVAVGEGRYLDENTIRAARITPSQIADATAKARDTLERRAELYRGNRPALQLGGRTIIVADDGVATGASVFAAIHALRLMQPAQLVLAIPVAPPSTCAWLRPQVDDLICLYAPEDFYAVGQSYNDFSQVTEEEVIALLKGGDSTGNAPLH